MSFFIHDAFASGNAAAQTGSSTGSLIMLVAFVGLFYLLLWLPQSKRVKAHRQLIQNLVDGDEVITNGGMLGRISKIKDDFIVLTIAENVDICLQKSAIAASVPKGTVKNIS